MERVALFRRRRPTAGLPAAGADFWAWWPGVAGYAARALDDGDAAALRTYEQALRDHVAALDPALTAGFVPGRFARHGLVVSAAGRADLRCLTQRWREAGPGDDLEWEYHPARPPAPEQFDQTLEVSGFRIDLAATVVEARTDDLRCRVDVGVFNAGLTVLPEADRERLALQAMQWALGEDDVERWLGEVVVLEARPLDPVPAPLLCALTEQFAQRWTGGRWAMLEGTHGRSRLVATVRQPLHRVDHPLFDQHLAVRLPYADRTLEGLPAEGASGDLQAFEDALVAQLGSAAVLVAHETSSGERVLHLYDDSTRSVAAPVRAMLGGYLPGGATVDVDRDPAWRLVEHLRL